MESEILIVSSTILLLFGTLWNLTNIISFCLWILLLWVVVLSISLYRTKSIYNTIYKIAL